MRHRGALTKRPRHLHRAVRPVVDEPQQLDGAEARDAQLARRQQAACLGEVERAFLVLLEDGFVEEPVGRDLRVDGVAAEGGDAVVVGVGVGVGVGVFGH